MTQKRHSKYCVRESFRIRVQNFGFKKRRTKQSLGKWVNQRDDGLCLDLEAPRYDSRCVLQKVNQGGIETMSGKRKIRRPCLVPQKIALYNCIKHLPGNESKMMCHQSMDIDETQSFPRNQRPIKTCTTTIVEITQWLSLRIQKLKKKKKKNLRWPRCLRLGKMVRLLATTIRLTVAGRATITNSLIIIVFFLFILDKNSNLGPINLEITREKPGGAHFIRD